LSNRRGKFVRFMVVRVEYDRSNRVCIRRTGKLNRPSHAVAQGANFSTGGGQAPCPVPLAPALRVDVGSSHSKCYTVSWKSHTSVKTSQKNCKNYFCLRRLNCDASRCRIQTHSCSMLYPILWLKLIHTATPDKARPARLPVDRRRDTGQAGSYA